MIYPVRVAAGIAKVSVDNAHHHCTGSPVVTASVAAWVARCMTKPWRKGLIAVLGTLLFELDRRRIDTSVRAVVEAQGCAACKLHPEKAGWKLEFNARQSV